MSNKRVVVGMSGGVDSAVSAALLKEQGFDVVGLYMSNWKEQDDNGCCTGEQDWTDVKYICDKIDIPYYSVDFSEEYMQHVFTLFVEEYKKGRTPNPDVLCNREVKFGPFADFARKLGADYIATGHYCRIRHEGGTNFLLRAQDENKDQTYFLNQVKNSQLNDVMFPLGDMVKGDVRELARKFGIPVAEKKDSTGICFIGERNFRNFLSKYIPMKEGNIITQDGKVVGHHKGVYFYTLGQRRGLGIGGSADGNGDRWFVLGKDVERNELIVSQGEDSVLFKKTLTTEGFNFITEPESSEFDCLVRIKHRQPLQKAHASVLENGDVYIDFEEKQRAVAPGQYAVIYSDQICLGGGVINRAE
ncbi:MAG: tRNA 2-thiouridine(34) synthase MnmA [Clostridia bacterium]|nr:tRNA 2-thiouridine(34) synthase MnmA [Clostridia bacterium]